MSCDICKYDGSWCYHGNKYCERNGCENLEAEQQNRLKQLKEKNPKPQDNKPFQLGSYKRHKK